MGDAPNPGNEAFIFVTDRQDSPGKKLNIAYFVLTDMGEQAVGTDTPFHQINFLSRTIAHPRHGKKALRMKKIWNPR